MSKTLTKIMSSNSSLDYFQQEGLVRLLPANQSTLQIDVFDNVSGKLTTALPPDVEDLVRIHKLIRKRKSFTVLEFGTGFSTIVIADALKKNKHDWENLKTKPKIRNRYMFQCFTVDTSEKWIATAKERIPEDLKDFITFQFSTVKIGTFNGQLCHYYESLPDVIPDFIYLDGPDPKSVSGSINGLSFQPDERTVMAADLLLMESTFLPGTFILIDGRTNNARFLKNNFKRQYEFHWNPQDDITTFELKEGRLGMYNVLGSDFF